MIETLDLFVQLDTPFLLTERLDRVKRLRATFTRSDVSITTKYRSILEAYEIELDYGNTIETYRENLLGSLDEESLIVDYFRLGRVGLYYLSIDTNQAGVWDKNNKQWVLLTTNQRLNLEGAIKMAANRAAPNLINLPIPSPVTESQPFTEEREVVQ